MLELDPAHRALVLAHAEEAYPNECCGFFLGEEAGGAKRVSEVRRAGNGRDDSPRNRYRIAPEEFLQADRAARGRGRSILGFYHSHPDAPPRPSAYDREHAWPGYTYVIVPVESGRAGEPRAWVVPGPDEPFAEEDLRVPE